MVSGTRVVDVKKLIQELVVPEIRQVLSEVQTIRVRSAAWTRKSTSFAASSRRR